MASWTSAAGVRLDFEVGSTLTDWNPVPGVYMFVRHSVGDPVALYVGKTDSFKDRLCAAHHKLTAAHVLGMTHIWAKVVNDARVRADLERALIQDLTPCLNEMLLPAAARGMAIRGLGSF